MNRFNNDSFERMLREKTDEFRLYPSRKVWSSLYNNLHPGSRWPSRAVSIGLLSLLLVLGHLNSKHQIGEHLQQTKIDDLASHSRSEAIAFIQPNEPVGSRPSQTEREDTISKSQLFQHFIPASSAPATGLYSIDKISLMPVALQNAIREQRNRVARRIKLQPGAGISVADRGGDAAVTTPVHVAITTTTQHPVFAASSAMEAGRNTVVMPEQISTRPSDVQGITPNNTAELGLDSPSAQQTNSVENELPSTSAPNSVLESAAKIVREHDQKTYSRWRQNWSSRFPTEPDLSYMDQVAERQRKRQAFLQKLSWTVWGTPSLVYRSLTYAPLPTTPVASTAVAPEPLNPEIDRSVQQQASWGFEVGGGFKLEFARRLRVSAGIQANYTRYNIQAYQNAHPVATTLTMNNFRTGTQYEVLRTTKFTNGYGMDEITLHNQTLQASLPIGLEYRIIGKQRIQWYVGTGIQPTLLVNGKAYLISSDRRNYIEESGMLRRWNVNASFETYVSYTGKNGLIWQVGPQFRRQLFSTNVRQYAVEELLNSYGIKVGISKPLR
jgi:hypothetical protein